MTTKTTAPRPTFLRRFRDIMLGNTLTAYPATRGSGIVALPTSTENAAMVMALRDEAAADAEARDAA